jgi:hypothetical protein
MIKDLRTGILLASPGLKEFLEEIVELTLQANQLSQYQAMMLLSSCEGQSSMLL